MRTGAVIVAAGMSSRMKAFKPMLMVGTVTVARRIISTLKQAGADPIVLVTGYQAQILEDEIAQMGVTCLRNNAYANSQMLDSAKIGLSYIQDKCDRILFTPVDVPLFTCATIKSLLDSQASVAVPVCNEHGGHPLLMDRQVAERLLAYTGGSGLAGAVSSCGFPIQKIKVEDEGVLMDMDTPEDYEKVLGRYRQGIKQ